MLFVENGADASSSRNRSIPDGRVLAVRNQGETDCDNEMRSIYVVFRRFTP